MPWSYANHLFQFIRQHKLAILSAMWISVPFSTDLHASNSSEEFEPYTKQINEFTDRRRTNVLFKNAQSRQYGLQVDYVNVGTGNFTFARRDLVVIDTIPIVITRVYDSSLDTSADFGPGWHLSLAETLRIRGDNNLLYIDSSASRNHFDADDLANPESLAQTGIVQIDKVSQDEFEITLNNGIKKRFKGGPRLYRLKSVYDSHGNNLDFTYRNGVISKVQSTAGYTVEFHRNGDGLINSIGDSLGRSVSYGYQNGQLTAAVDLDGNEWSYEYDLTGRLKRLIDPLEHVIGNVTYNRSGKVQFIDINGITRRIRYAGRLTTVRDGFERPSQFVQNDRGYTTTIRNREGDTYEISFDETGRVVELQLNQKLIANINHGQNETTIMEYSDSSELAKVVKIIQQENSGQVIEAETIESGDVKRLTYDANQRLVQAEESTSTVSYSYYPNSNLVRERVTNDGQMLQFTFMENGQLNTISDQTGNRITLFHTLSGRLGRIVFPDGTSTDYDYDSMGLRHQATPSYGGRAEYNYNPNGSLQQSEIFLATGQSGGQRVELDDHGRVKKVIYPNIDREAQVFYDESSNPIEVVTQSIGTGADQISTVYEYDRLQRLTAVRSSHGLNLNYDYDRFEPDLRLQHDRQMTEVPTTVMLGTHTFGYLNEVVNNRLAIPSYEFIYFNEVTHELSIAPEPQDNTRLFEHSLVRFRINDLEKLKTEQGRTDFEMASNAIYLPAEFTNTNCCAPYPCFGYDCPCNDNPLDPDCLCFPPPVTPPPGCTIDFDLTATNNNFNISATPSMPTITASVTSLSPSNASISWQAIINHTSPPDCEGGTQFPSNSVTANGNSFSPIFNAIYGGTLSVTARCSASGYAVRNKVRTQTIGGTQPAQITIASHINSQTLTNPMQSVDLRQIGCWESGGGTQYIQFLSNGSPLYSQQGTQGDVGIMQICNSLRTSQTIWNWQNNVAAGAATLNLTRNSAKNHLDFQVNNDGAAPYNNDMWREEAIHRYNAGTGVNVQYWDWNVSTMTWVIQPVGGVGNYVPNVRGSQCN